MSTLTPTNNKHSLANQLAEIITSLEHSVYEPDRVTAAALRPLHRELADRETLLLNLPGLWRDIARRERERADHERGAGGGGAAVYEAVAAQLEQGLR